MENALDHSRRRLHLRPEPSTPAVPRLTTVLLSIIFQVRPGSRADATSMPPSLRLPVACSTFSLAAMSRTDFGRSRGDLARSRTQVQRALG